MQLLAQPRPQQQQQQVLVLRAAVHHSRQCMALLQQGQSLLACSAAWVTLMICWGRCGEQQTAGDAQLSQHQMQLPAQPAPQQQQHQQQQRQLLLPSIKMRSSRAAALMPMLL
jgi:hypothetical protein